MSSFRYIMLPVCATTTNSTTRRGRRQDGRHWLLLVADTATQTISVLNSKPDDDTNDHYVKLFRYYKDLRF